MKVLFIQACFDIYIIQNIAITAAYFDCQFLVVSK